MKAESCPSCKGKGKYIQSVNLLSGPRSRTVKCLQIFQHYREAVELLVKIRKVYATSIAVGKERLFLKEMKALMGEIGDIE